MTLSGELVSSSTALRYCDSNRVPNTQQGPIFNIAKPSDIQRRPDFGKDQEGTQGRNELTSQIKLNSRLALSFVVQFNSYFLGPLDSLTLFIMCSPLTFAKPLMIP
jgi:hypothetical protein